MIFDDLKDTKMVRSRSSVRFRLRAPHYKVHFERLRHLFYPLEPHRVRGRNTENKEIGKDVELAEYQGKRHIIMKFIHKEKHVIFEPIGRGRRKKEVSDGIQVIIALTVYKR